MVGVTAGMAEATAASAVMVADMEVVLRLTANTQDQIFPMPILQDVGD
jgi:hypothetical protein